MSFSHSADRRVMSSNSPPKTQMLGSCYEYSVDETADTLGKTHLDDSKQQTLRPQRSYQLMNPATSSSLWFNENGPTASAVAAAAALNRRHSMATTVDSFLLQQSQSPVPPMSNTIGGSPGMPSSNFSPPVSMAAHIREKAQRASTPDQVYNDVTNYFELDVFGRKNSFLNSTESISPGAAAALISVPSSRLYLVEFKACRVDVFYITESSSLSVQVGDLVIVDADRGRDLGKVMQIHVTPEQAGLLKWRQHQDQQAALQTPGDTSANGQGPGGVPQGSAGTNGSTGPNIMTPKQILRYAQPNEIQQIINKRNDEEAAVKACTAKVQEKNLSMVVLDAEYQWDRRKLTFFYSASHRIDFRDLVRDLFRIYKTRIWMCAMHPSQPQPQSPLSATRQQSQPAQHPLHRQEQNGYHLQEQQLQQQPDFSPGQAYSPWKYSVAPMVGRRFTIPANMNMNVNMNMQHAGPPLWAAPLYEPCGVPPPGTSGVPGSTVPGGLGDNGGAPMY